MADLMNDNRIYRLLKSILSATIADVGRTEQSDHDALGRWAKKDGGGIASASAAPEVISEEKFRAALNEDVKVKQARLSDDAHRVLPTKHQANAIGAYTGNGYIVINKFLRTIGTNKDGSVKKGLDERDHFYEDDFPDETLVYNDATIESLEKFVNEHPLSQDTMLYRTCGRGALTGQYFDFLLSKGIGRYASPEKVLDAIVGQVGVDKGFMSTSYSKGNYLDNLFEEEIYAPKGTPAVLVESWSSMSEEKEVIVQRNLKKMVTGWEKKQRVNGTTYYVVHSQIVWEGK